MLLKICKIAKHLRVLHQRQFAEETLSKISSRKEFTSNFQFSRVANILQPSRGRVSEEIQAICQFFAWPRFPCICCWARMARLAAHFVVNLEQIEVNIFPLFTLLPSFLLLLSQTAHGNLVHSFDVSFLFLL